MSDVIDFEPVRRRPHPPAGGSFHFGPAEFFNRDELDRILQLYSRKVMAGEWLDYAVGCGEAGAVFAVFGRASDVPLLSIWKRPKSVRRAGRYQVNIRNRVLSTEKSLDAVLKFLERRRPKLVAGDQI